MFIPFFKDVYCTTRIEIQQKFIAMYCQTMAQSSPLDTIGFRFFVGAKSH